MEKIVQFLNENVIISMFSCLSLGYAIGRIRIGGIGLGSAGVLFVALIYGHFGVEVPSIIQNLGLALFVASIGISSGPSFFRYFKRDAIAYIFIGIFVILSASGTCVLFMILSHVSPDLLLGLLAGALTTTPGLATALECTGSDLVSVGYGIAYPFGVIAVVLFVQIIPVILKSNMNKERQFLESSSKCNFDTNAIKKSEFRIDPIGFFVLSIVIVSGVLIGKIRIPLWSQLTFSLGVSGGPLISGILVGFIQSRGVNALRVDSQMLKHTREIGLVFFLLGAGVKAGKGFVKVISEHGLIVLMIGAILTIIPIIFGYFITKMFKLPLLKAMGAICGGMTSTPALGTLIRVSGTDDVGNPYAATYPFALITIILVFQFMGSILF